MQDTKSVVDLRMCPRCHVGRIKRVFIHRQEGDCNTRHVFDCSHGCRATAVVDEEGLRVEDHSADDAAKFEVFNPKATVPLEVLKNDSRAKWRAMQVGRPKGRRQ